MESVHANLHVSIEWINNKVLLCYKGNYTQFLRINHNGKEYEKEYTHTHTHTHTHAHIYVYVFVHVTESICCRAEIITTL